MTRKYKVIACKVMMREMYHLATKSKNIIDILWLKQALHNTPDILRETLQKTIDDVENEAEDYDAILLGYCLCSNGIVGIHSKNIPIVVPKGHDCITMLLGSKEKYKKIFDEHNGGIYWYSPGWIEQTLQPGKERYEQTFEHYIKKYGEDNAEYLMEMEQGWLTKYNCALYVDWSCMHCKEYEDYTKECAGYLSWEFRKEQGSDILISDMFEGKWDESRFLIVPPNKTIKPSYDDEVIEVDEPH